MNLGNHGWGMREMVIYLCIFAIILLFVAISINSLYRRIEKDNEETKNNQPVIVEPVQEEQPKEEVDDNPRVVNYTYYHEMEEKLYNATYKYLEEKPTEIGNGILKIDDNTLVNLGYMSTIYNDIGSMQCTGYSNVYVHDGDADYTVKSFIKCDNYTSEGY